MCNDFDSQTITKLNIQHPPLNINYTLNIKNLTLNIIYPCL